jgi:putative membrane protein
MFGNTTPEKAFAKLAIVTGAVTILVSGATGLASQSSQAATQSQSQATTQSQQSAPREKMPEQASMPGREEDFVKDAAQSSQIEIESSKLAMTKASNPEVKAFAEKLVKDHTDASAELMKLVHSKNAMWPPDDPGMKAKKQKHESLQKLTGAEFDKEYLEDMISDHEAAMVVFGKESQSGKDAAIKAFADKTLPALRDHLKMARDLRAKIAK